MELALKRTDYIVIDDRDAEQRGDSENKLADSLEELKKESPDDLRPLSASEVSRLGWNTAAYVMGSEDPLDTLIKLSQDFPKYSSVVAAHNATVPLKKEVRANRARMIPSGGNLMWINGVQIDQRQIDAFSLLDHLRRERQLIEKFRGLGLSAQDAVKLLSHPLLAESHADDDSQRYDYRDELEGGEVIIWLNNLEKDSRYQEWPGGLEAYVQNAYPGQLPPVARDLHNVIVPVDLSKSEDILLILQQLYTFIKRGIPVRFGLVPTAESPESIAQLKVAHYLQDAFGLSAFIQYLEEVRYQISSNVMLDTNVDLFSLLQNRRQGIRINLFSRLWSRSGSHAQTRKPFRWRKCKKMNIIAPSQTVHASTRAAWTWFSMTLISWSTEFRSPARATGCRR